MKLKYDVHFLFRQEEQKESFDDLEDAFDFIHRMEDGPGGFAYAVRADGNTYFSRKIDDEKGIAWWLNGLTGEQFV